MKVCAACGALVADEQVHRNFHGTLAGAGIPTLYSGQPFIHACPLDGEINSGPTYGTWACGHSQPQVIYP